MEIWRSRSGKKVKQTMQQVRMSEHVSDILVAAKRGTTWVDQEIGLRIRARRLDLRMSQVALADAIGVTFQQVQKYEKGQNRISAAMLIKIASVLGLTAAELMPNLENDSQEAQGSEELLAELAVALKQIRDPKARRLLVQIAKTMADDTSF